MAGKFITKVQQTHVAGLTTSLVARVDQAGNAWQKQEMQDFEIAYGALGVPCPFQMQPIAPKLVRPPIVEPMIEHGEGATK